MGRGRLRYSWDEPRHCSRWTRLFASSSMAHRALDSEGNSPAAALIPRRPGQAASSDGTLRLMFVHTFMPVGGAETLLVNLIRRLDRTRFAPEICCLKFPGPLGEVMAGEIPVFSHLLGGKYDLRVPPRLTRLLLRRRIDAVVTVGAGDRMFWGRLAA